MLCEQLVLEGEKRAEAILEMWKEKRKFIPTKSGLISRTSGRLIGFNYMRTPAFNGWICEFDPYTQKVEKEMAKIVQFTKKTNLPCIVKDEGFIWQIVPGTTYEQAIQQRQALEQELKAQVHSVTTHNGIAIPNQIQKQR